MKFPGIELLSERFEALMYKHAMVGVFKSPKGAIEVRKPKPHELKVTSDYWF